MNNFRVAGSISGNSGGTSIYPFNHVLHRRRSQPEIVPLLRHQSQGDIDSSQCANQESSSFINRKRTSVRPISGPETVTVESRGKLPSNLGGLLKSSSSELSSISNFGEKVILSSLLFFFVVLVALAISPTFREHQQQQQQHQQYQERHFDFAQVPPPSAQTYQEEEHRHKYFAERLGDIER